MDEMYQVFIFTSPEIKQLLHNTNVELLAALQQQDLELTKTYAKDPTNPDSGEKDVATVLLASSAVITALTPTIAKLISTLLPNKKVIIQEKVLLPVTNEKGEIVLDNEGNPLVYWEDRHRVMDLDHNITSRKSTFKMFGIEIASEETVVE